MSLAHLVALRDDYTDPNCWAWMESAERRCDKPAGPQHLCPQHVKVAERRLERLRAKEIAKQQREKARAVENLANNEARLAILTAKLERIDRRMAYLDPPPPTTDPAAWGGIPNATATVYRRRITSDRVVSEMAGLHDRRSRLQTLIASVQHQINLAQK